jgi:hypothetical protein
MDRGRLEHSFNSRTIMAKKIVQPVEVQASVKGDESVKSFRAQLREAQQEALRLAEAFGETDARTLAAAGKVAQLRDRMDDLNATIAGLHPDRFERIATITGTLANGFAAAQGAAALLGGESEELQKQMVRVQGAMALSQGIAGIKDMGKQIAGLAGDAKKMLIPAFTSVAGAARAVGAALGIGLIIAGITALIALVQKLDISLDGVSKSDKKLLESQQARLKASQDQVDALDASDNILKAQGKSEKEILQMKIAALKVVIDNQRAVIETSKAQATAQIAASQRNKDILVGILNFITAPLRLLLNTVDAVASKLGYETGLLKGFEEMVQSVSTMAFDPAETKKQADADLKEMQDGLLAMQNTLAGHQLAVKAIDANAAKEAKAARDEAAAEEAAKEKELQSQREQREKEELERTKTRLKEEEAIRKAALEERARQEKEHLDYVNSLYAAEAAARKQSTDIFFNNLRERLAAHEEHKRTIEAATSQSLGALASLFDQGSAAQKAFALAQIAADSGAAIAAALRNSQSPTPDNAATGGLAGLAKFAAIAAVIITNSARAVQIVKGGNRGGGISAPAGATGGGIQRPSLPSSSTLGGGSQMAGEWNTRVFVTEGDITGTQRRVNMLRGASVI